MSLAVGVQVLRGRIMKGSLLGFTRAGSASLGRGLVSCPAASGVPSGRTYRSTRSPVDARLILRRRGCRGCVPRGHGGCFRFSSDVSTGGAAGWQFACVGNAVMPTTVVATGTAVVQVESHGGVQVDVVAVGGRSVSEEGLEVCGSEEASPLAVGPTGVGFGRAPDVPGDPGLPSWRLRGARRNRFRILRAARRA
jgi:hypothetical protein